MFVIYPAVSIASMMPFNCDSQVGLLRADYREVCGEMTSFLPLYSLAFVLLYPIGTRSFSHHYVPVSSPMLLFATLPYRSITDYPLLQPECKGDHGFGRLHAATHAHAAHVSDACT
jgi:hypothetical protein